MGRAFTGAAGNDLAAEHVGLPLESPGEVPEDQPEEDPEAAENGHRLHDLADIRELGGGNPGDRLNPRYGNRTEPGNQ